MFRNTAAFCLLITSLTANAEALSLTTCYSRLVVPIRCIQGSRSSCSHNNWDVVEIIIKNESVKIVNKSDALPQIETLKNLSQSVGPYSAPYQVMYLSSTHEILDVALSEISLTKDAEFEAALQKN
ncbi:MAG: hypothetical protein SGI74_05965 [Oligoflexia bacterium]|nr:hypothetical protein [Oligoflexia bacterium]